MDVTAHNNGWYTVAVADGAAKVKHTRERPPDDTTPCPVLDVRGLAALFTGHSQPAALAAAGLLWQSRGRVQHAAGASSTSDGRGDGTEGKDTGAWAAAMATLRALFCSHGAPCAEEVY